MSWDEKRRELSAALYRADGSAVVALLRGNEWPEHALQLVGDGVLAALDQGVPGASEIADACAEQLADRGWDGDPVTCRSTAVPPGQGTGPVPETAAG